MFIELAPPITAAIVLSVSLFAQENRLETGMAGASWVHNIQAGYCLYHYWFRNNKHMLVFLGTWAELIGDAVAFSGIMGSFNDAAHLEGLVEGLLAGYLLDMVFKKKQPLF